MSDDYDKPWTVLESSYAMRDEWLVIRSDKVRLPTGRVLDAYHTMEGPDWVSALAITEDQDIVLVEQYRHPIGRTIIELPAGAVDARDASPLVAAKRELREETGYESDEWNMIGSCAANPARQTNASFGFLALGARKLGQPRPEDTEFIRTILVPLEEFRLRLEAGTLELPAYHICCLWWLRHFARASGDARLAAWR